MYFCRPACFKSLRRFSSVTKFNFRDPLQLDKLLTEEEKEIREAARDFADKSLKPKVLDSFRHNTFDPNVHREIGQAGFFGVPFSGYGCRKISNVAFGLINKEFEKVDSNYRSAVSTQCTFVMTSIYNNGSEEMKSQWLPKLASGECIGTYGVAEAHSGFPNFMKTSVKDMGDHYLINGDKKFIRFASIADMFLIIAFHENGQMVCILVESGTEGVTVKPVNNSMCARGLDAGDIILDNVKVPKENLVFAKESIIDENFHQVLGIAWGAMGAAEACYETARDYVIHRKQFDTPLSSNPIIQQKLVDM